MGNSATGGYEDDEHELDKFDGIETLGYRVLGVQPNSPASQAGLVSFFDFLVGANGQMLLGSGEELEEGDEYDDIDFPAMLMEHKGRELELLVWNIKSQQKRLVNICTQDGWGGAGLLGVTIRLDNYGGADERLIRVLEMEPNSPASVAGLVPLQDYLLGTTTESFEDTQVLADVLHAHVDRVVELYVYNTTSDVVRIVALMPTWSWGGKGLLGAEVGTGYLHRLPRECRATGGTSVERKVRWTRHGAGDGSTKSGGATATKTNATSTSSVPAVASASQDPQTQEQQQQPSQQQQQQQQQQHPQQQQHVSQETTSTTKTSATSSSNAPTPTMENQHQPSLSARPNELYVEPQFEMEPEPHQQGTVQTATVDEISKPIEPVVPPTFPPTGQQQQQYHPPSAYSNGEQAPPIQQQPAPNKNDNNRPSVATKYSAPTASPSAVASSVFAASPPSTAEAVFSAPPPVLPSETTTSALPPTSASSTSSYNSAAGAGNSTGATPSYYGGYNNNAATTFHAAGTSYGNAAAPTTPSKSSATNTVTPFMPAPPLSHLSR